MPTSLDSPDTKHASDAVELPTSALQNELTLLRASLGNAAGAGVKDVTATPGKSAIMAAADFAIGIGLTAVSHNRSAGVMVERALAVGFGTAIIGDMVHGPLAKEGWTAAVDALHHPENLGEDKKNFGRMLGRTLVDGVISSVGCLGGQFAGLPFSKLENLMVEDGRENFLRTGVIEKDGFAPGQAPSFLKDFDESGMRTGRVTANGESVEVITRDPMFRGNYFDRFRKEQAIYKLQKLVGLDTDSVANAMQVEQQGGQSFKLWLQENRGPSMADFLEKRTGVSQDAGNSLNVYANYLQTQAPELKDKLGKTLLERLLAGDTDSHLGNIAVRETAESVSTANLDAVRAFKPFKVPIWSEINETDPVTELYSGTAIDHQDLQQLDRFVTRFDTSKGRAELGTLDLSPKEVTTYLARAKWFVKNGIFPKSI